MTTSFQRWRRIAGAAQALVVLGLPFVSVGGESALRLDVPGGRLLAFGATFAVDEGFVVLAAVLFLAAAFLLVTVLFGRVWCGWSCPQTVLGEFTAPVAPERRARPRRWRRPVGFLLVFLVSALFSAATLWYFVPPQEFLRRLAAGALGPVLGGAWAALGAVLFADLAFVRGTFCATVCPYARLQGVLFDPSTLVVAYDARRAADCVDCGACVRVCPTGIDIRDGLQMECIACAACIDACRPIMARLRRAPDLVGYFHGAPGAPRRLVRPATVALAAATAAALVGLVAVVAGRDLVGLVASADAGFAARRGADGRVVNAYAVALENRARTPVSVTLALAPSRAGAEGWDVSVRPDTIALHAGEHRQVRVVATARGLPAGVEPALLVAEVRAGERVLERRSTKLSILVPEAP
ncbi:4Fe-4S dicluster domain-containing protein [Anaeromyxobacter oryzae]|uniref:Ferredoxin n=1 Tax=Anaeromyxobacter oryzae TaxID=2918170 RepID=A0ABM7WR16_9BACT|nr:4Fe-4S dicluster domain-containing protein [Anaeromyxobacter oryzae]BDG01908.1 ferredoxin [Anaeromyxobacter oryzae]